LDAFDKVSDDMEQRSLKQMIGDALDQYRYVHYIYVGKQCCSECGLLYGGSQADTVIRSLTCQLGGRYPQ